MKKKIYQEPVNDPGDVVEHHGCLNLLLVFALISRIALRQYLYLNFIPMSFLTYPLYAEVLLHQLIALPERLGLGQHVPD